MYSRVVPVINLPVKVLLKVWLWTLLWTVKDCIPVNIDFWSENGKILLMNSYHILRLELPIIYIYI